MKAEADKTRFKRGFTIVELLTVISIMIILISLLVPGLAMAKRYAKYVKQKNQFRGINISLELFNAEWDGYPPSDQFDPTGTRSYCGAMKLAEAMVGQDMLGFHPASRFVAKNTLLYTGTTVKERKEYLPLDSANAQKLGDIYSTTGPFDPCDLVLCDSYTNVTNIGTGRKIGMPILYYKANTSKTLHDFAYPNDSIYNFQDNIDLVSLPVPFMQGGFNHPMASSGTTSDGGTANPALFYDYTLNEQVSITRPHNADSYILISAGFDGEYGTPDDVYNFGE